MRTRFHGKRRKFQKLIEQIRAYTGHSVTSPQPLWFETYTDDHRPVRIQIGCVNQSLADLRAEDASDMSDQFDDSDCSPAGPVS